MCVTFSLIQESIYAETAYIFGHVQPKNTILARQILRNKIPIQLVHGKNLLLVQIELTSLPQQQAALTPRLINFKCRIQSLRKLVSQTSKTCKSRKAH